MKERLNFVFYGDDFTGSTDAMEALTLHGLRTVLFLEVPTEEVLNEFDGLACIGIAGTSRAKSPDGMRDELQPIYEKVAELNPRLFHYKVCSTFDSSPKIGSIGYAADLARQYFDNKHYELLVAVPQLGRFTVFGEHFAKKDGKVYRLDRHPVVSNHPITPMKEADLSVHLAKQTKQSIGVIDVLDLEGGSDSIARKVDELNDRDILIYDALKEEDLRQFAERVTYTNTDRTRFLIGSSGVEYALGSLWGKDATAPVHHVTQIDRRDNDDDRMLVVSGSLSKITSEQLEQAESDGFHLEQIPHYYFGNNNNIPEGFLDLIADLIEDKRKVILYTANGPEDPSIAQMNDHLGKTNKDEFGHIIGRTLGKWTKEIIKKTEIQRLIVAGGDISGFVTRELDIYALEVIKSISPGAPLCRAYSKDKKIDKLSVALKGGQLGGRDYYKRVWEYKE